MARVAAAAATSATLWIKMALSSGVKEESRSVADIAEIRGSCDGRRFAVPLGPAMVVDSLRSIRGDGGLCAILSPMCFKKGSSGILFRQFANDD
jgi:hypothetical protein